MTIAQTGRISSRSARRERRITSGPQGRPRCRPPGTLSQQGQIAKAYIEAIDEAYDRVVQVDNYVIMPNHVHLILSIHPENVGGRRPYGVGCY